MEPCLRPYNDPQLHHVDITADGSLGLSCAGDTVTIWTTSDGAVQVRCPPRLQADNQPYPACKPTTDSAPFAQPTSVPPIALASQGRLITLRSCLRAPLTCSAACLSLLCCLAHTSSVYLACLHVHTPRLQRELKGHIGDVYCARFFPSGEVVLSVGPHPTPFLDPLHATASSDPMQSTRCVTDHYNRQGGADRRLQIWSALDGSCAVTMTGHSLGITDVGFVDRGRNVICEWHHNHQ